MASETHDIPDKHVAKSRVAELYGTIAPSYDLFARLTETKAHERCLELASIQDGESVLEVPVGTGLAFEKILSTNPSGRNEGIDVTEAMLVRAEKRASKLGLDNYRLRVGDAYQMDFPDNDFDVLISNYLFNLLPQEEFGAVLEEFKMVLRPGGRLIIINMTKGRHWCNNGWDWLYRFKPAWIGACRGVLLVPHVEASGFTRTKRDYVTQLTFPSEIVSAVAPDIARSI